MLAHGLGEGTEDYPLVRQRLTEGGGDAHGVEDGVHRHLARLSAGELLLGFDARQHLPFAEGYAQLVEGLHELGYDFGRAFAVLLGSGVVDYVLIVDFGQFEVAPARLGHLLPFAECVQAEVQQPLRLLLLGGNQTNDVFVQAFGHVLLLDLGDEAFLVFTLRYVFQQIIHLRGILRFQQPGGRCSAPAGCWRPASRRR